MIISKDDTIIMGGAGPKEEIEERVQTLESGIDNTSSEYDKEKL
jgi:chaperonin GroEL